MMERTSILTASLFAVTSLMAQVDSLAIRYAATITEGELREHLTILASDAYMGRDTGKEGQKMAAAYLKRAFVAAGIPPVPGPFDSTITDGYFQSYGLIEERAGGITIRKGERTLTYKKELAYFNEQLEGGREVDRLIVVGAGKDLPKGDLAGTALVLIGSEIGGTKAIMSNVMERMQTFRNAGASVVLVSIPALAEVVDEFHLPGSRVRLASGQENGTKTLGATQLILVDEGAMEELVAPMTLAKLKKKKPGKSVAVSFRIEAASTSAPLVAENVLGYIEGSDKKEELVVLTAHYDHIGVEDGVVYNGADDDGTGTVALLEIAEAFAAAKAAGHGPRRSVLVMPVSGEEKGLLGSRYYSDHPVFPLANTVADLNIDMIGRVDSAHEHSEPYIYIIGSDRLSSGLHAANEQANATYVQLQLDETFNAENDPNRFYYRSDHYNFARKGVPSIFYFSGVHEDYHQPGDDVEKIRFDLLHQRTLLVFHTAWLLATQEKRIEVDKAPKP